MDQSNTEEMALNKKMPRNLINTAKYNVLNFIPLNLFNQFKKIQNLYFTVITFMQMQQSITITSGLPTVGYNLVPLIILSMIKDAFEDYKRHKADKSENEKKALVYNLAKCTFE
jgi:phospholipid-transporting ATPase